MPVVPSGVAPGVPSPMSLLSSHGRETGPVGQNHRCCALTSVHTDRQPLSLCHLRGATGRYRLTDFTRCHGNDSTSSGLLSTVLHDPRVSVDVFRGVCYSETSALFFRMYPMSSESHTCVTTTFTCLLRPSFTRSVLSSVDTTPRSDPVFTEVGVKPNLLRLPLGCVHDD